MSRMNSLNSIFLFQNFEPSFFNIKKGVGLILLLFLGVGIAFGQDNDDNQMPGSTEAVVKDPLISGDLCIQLESGFGTFNGKVRVANLDVLHYPMASSSYALPNTVPMMFLKLEISGSVPTNFNMVEYYPVDQNFTLEGSSPEDGGCEGSFNIYSHPVQMDFLLDVPCDPEVEIFMDVDVSLIAWERQIYKPYPLPLLIGSCETNPLNCLWPSCYFYEVPVQDGSIHTQSYTNMEACCELEAADRGLIINQPVIKNDLFSTSTYPNPFNDQIKLDLNLRQDNTSTVQIFDLTGKEVYFKKRNLPAGSHKAVIDTKKLVPGAYIIKIQSGNEVNTHRLIKN